MSGGDFQKRFVEYVDARQRLYIERLAEAVAIPSVSSALPDSLPDINKMINWTKAHAERLGAKTTLIDNPVSTAEKSLPPILCGHWHVNDKYKTLCVYGHLDVQPANKDDGWHTDPFTLTEKDGKLFGRGSTDDKGPALSWLWIVEAHNELGIELPVNLKILYEGMEEYGSEGLFETIATESKERGFLNDVVRIRYELCFFGETLHAPDLIHDINSADCLLGFLLHF